MGCLRGLLLVLALATAAGCGGEEGAPADRVEGHGIRADLPEGWSGRIVRPPDPAGPETSPPFLHAGNFAIPPDGSAFGSTLTEDVTRGRLAMMLVTYAADSALRPGVGLYQERGMPRITAADFSARRLQVGRPGHVGHQAFFTISDQRLGVLYVVSGGMPTEAMLAELNRVIDDLEVASTSEGSNFQKIPRI